MLNVILAGLINQEINASALFLYPLSHWLPTTNHLDCCGLITLYI